MTKISVVREQENKYNAQGNYAYTDETYIKIYASFSELLQELKGARLSAFIALALNESEISFGRSNGLSVYDIANSTGYKVRATLLALQYLCQSNFSIKLEQRGEKGETLYRVSAYAWFGNKSESTASNSRYAENAHPVTKCIGMQHSSSRLIQSDSDLNLTTPTSMGECAKILQAANVRTSDLDLSSMEVERAQAIAEYIRENPEKKRSPAGWVYTLLKANPNWKPPQIRQQSWYDEYKEFIQR